MVRPTLVFGSVLSGRRVDVHAADRVFHPIHGRIPLTVAAMLVTAIRTLGFEASAILCPVIVLLVLAHVAHGLGLQTQTPPGGIYRT